MNQIVTQGIVLRRINYGEADRIITLLTPDCGKLRLIAKGVRRAKSKLAGGIELLSVNDITFIKGKRDIGTLVSSRLSRHYGEIVKDIDRTMLAYELIRLLDKNTEDMCEPEYFQVLQEVLAALDDPAITSDIIQIWLQSQLLRLAGFTPNLQSDTKGQKLQADELYNFDFTSMAFEQAESGVFTANDIKFLRLLFGKTTPKLLAKVRSSQNLAQNLTSTIRAVVTMHLAV